MNLLFTVKFIASGSWEEKLVNYAKGFEGQKGKIEFTLSLHVTITLDATSEAVAQIQTKVDLLITLFHQRSADEKKLESAIAQRGGREKVLDDHSALEEVANIAKNMGASEKPEKGKDKGKPEKVDATLMHSLRASVEDLMEDNKAIFEMKIESVINAIEKTEARILAGLRAGAHERILDPVSRESSHYFCTKAGHM